MLPKHPHYVGDAAFGSFELLQEINSWGGTATLSMSTTSSSFLWEVLSLNVPSASWRVAINSQGLIGSSHVLYDKSGSKLVYQQLLSSGFNPGQYVSTNAQVNSDPLSGTLLLFHY